MCRVLFKKKTKKLLHLCGCIIRMYHDARSPERQTDNDVLLMQYFLRKENKNKLRQAKGLKTTTYCRLLKKGQHLCKNTNENKIWK